MLGWLLHERGIELHIPIFNKSGWRDNSFSRSDFTYDHLRDRYRCPVSQFLTTSGTFVNDGATLLY